MYEIKTEYVFEFDFFIDGRGEQIIKPYSMENFTMAFAYYKDDRPYPIYKTTLTFSSNDMQNLIKFKSTTFCRVKCKLLEPPAGYSDYVVFEDEFQAMFNEEAAGDILSSDVKNYAGDAVNNDVNPVTKNSELIQMGGDPNVMGTTIKNPVVFTLYSTKCFRFNKTPYCMIFGNSADGIVQQGVPVSTVILAMLQMNKEKIPTYTANVSNVTRFTDIAIPQTETFAMAMKFLQRNYGVYLNGILVKFFLGNLYILGKYLINNLIDTKSLVTRLKIYENDSTNNIEEKLKIEDDGSYSLNVYTRLKTNPYSMQMGESAGNNLIVSDFGHVNQHVKMSDNKVSEIKQPYTVIERLEETHARTGVRNKYSYDMTNNPYNINEYLRDSSQSQIISIPNIIGADPRMFAPNRIVELSIDDPTRNTKYGGKKVITGLEVTFQNTKTTEKFIASSLTHVVLNTPDDYAEEKSE